MWQISTDAIWVGWVAAFLAILNSEQEDLRNGNLTSAIGPGSPISSVSFEIIYNHLQYVRIR